MKIWLLNNTKLDKYKDWESYFDDVFIPLIEKYSKDEDIILHLGHIFNNSDLIQTKLLNKTLSMYQRIAELKPIYFLDGYDTELLKLLKTNKNTIIIDKPFSINNIKIIPKKFNIIENIEKTDNIIFINSKIDQSLLERYNDKYFYCGLYDMKKENNNIINVGTPYQFDINSSAGIYVVDTVNRKKKYIKNNKTIEYNILKITNIEQIKNLDKEYINNNNISVEIDKTLIEVKNLKIDVLLNDYNFKSISYINEEKNIELIDSSSLKMEDLLKEKIKNSDNEKILSEFENIMKIYKERY